MYSYMNGKIQKVLATHIVLECNNIGYLIKVPNPYSFSENVTTCVHLHLIVREDAHDLYGFLTDLERDMFVKLINVKGLGPKGALAILASSSPEEIIANFQFDYLKNKVHSQEELLLVLKSSKLEWWIWIK